MARGYTCTDGRKRAVQYYVECVVFGISDTYHRAGNVHVVVAEHTNSVSQGVQVQLTKGCTMQAHAGLARVHVHTTQLVAVTSTLM